MANEYAYTGSNTADFYFEYVGNNDGNRWCGVGRDKETWDTVVNGALRFLSVAIAQGTTVDYAEIRFNLDEREGGGGAVRYRCYGIDEDNTASFSSSPFSRDKTSSYQDGEWINPSQDDTLTIDVTGEVNEILARGGWSSGNAMGFIIDDRGTDPYDDDYNNYVVNDSLESGTFCYLVIRLSAEPDFTPGPYTVAAPSFPATKDYGIKISQPGIDVKSATEAQLYFTSRKKVFKVKDEAEVSCTSGVTKNIAHGLGYKPPFLAYAEGNGYRVKLPRGAPNLTDPFNSAVGYIGSDATNVKITAYPNSDVYYYIFIDPLEE